jgi:hypothetical protein
LQKCKILSRKLGFPTQRDVLAWRASSARGAISGGNWNNGANDGRFALNLNNAPSNTNNNIGFRCALPEVKATRLSGGQIHGGFAPPCRAHLTAGWKIPGFCFP